jgi:hypothetical protein
MDFSLKERFSKENIGKMMYNYWGKKKSNKQMKTGRGRRPRATSLRDLLEVLCKRCSSKLAGDIL